MSDFSIIISAKKGDEFENFRPATYEGIEWNIPRKGSPSKLTCTVIKDKLMGEIGFNEGDELWLMYKDQPVFKGFIFEKERDKYQHITITAYDQLRYLKNKFSYNLKGLRHDFIIERIFQDEKLKYESVPSIPTISQRSYAELETYFDIIYRALDEHTIISEKTNSNYTDLYTMFDDAGVIKLKRLDEMILDIVIDHSSAENFNYKSSIDEQTYNEILFYSEIKGQELNSTQTSSNKVVGELSVTGQAVGTKAYTNASRIGKLRYIEKYDGNPAQAQDLAKKYLDFYDRKSRSLTIENVFGDIRVRGGSLIPVMLDLGDQRADTPMVVDEVTHIIDESNHHMDLTLIGNKDWW